MENFLHNMDWVLPLRSDWATPIANGFTWLGYTPFFLMFLPLGYWLWDRAIFTRLAVLIAITAVINGWLKDFWQDARPDPRYWIDNRVEGSPGRPSGHAQVAVAMWLWLAYEMRRRWAWVAAILIAAGVALSRLYVGVHDVDDILTGAALGLASIVLFIWLLGRHSISGDACPSSSTWRSLWRWCRCSGWSGRPKARRGAASTATPRSCSCFSVGSPDRRSTIGWFPRADRARRSGKWLSWPSAASWCFLRCAGPSTQAAQPPACRGSPRFISARPLSAST